MASDEKRMSESLIDNVQRKLLEKISSQALHLGNLNSDLREAAEYIKLCELKLASLEEAVSASQSLRDSHEQSNLENKALIQKLLMEVEDKGQKHSQCEKKLAESRKEAQKIRVQLETAQHSLRLASQPSGQADNENQSKVNARLRSEVMALNSKIRSYKDQLQAVQSAPLHQGTFEVLSRKSRAVCDAATLGKLVSNNPEKSPALNSIHRFGKHNEGREHSSVGSAVDDKCSPQSYKKIATQDNKQCTSHEGEGEGEIVRRDAAAMYSAESDAKIKTLGDERDALLDYIQEDLTKSTEIGLRLQESMIELSNCKKSHCEMQERAIVLESRLENEVVRTSMLVSDLNASQMHATRIEEQYRIESAHKSEEAKKGAYIISVLTGELKTARNKLVELEEEVSHKGVISNIEQQQQQQQQQRVSVDATSAATGFEHSRKLTIELLSLRRLRDEWELEKAQRPRAVDAALLELTTDLTALAERDMLSAPHREMSEIFMKLGAPLSSSSTTAAEAVAATRGKPGYSDRYAYLRQSSDPHYMGSCSSSRSNTKGHTKPTLEDELSAQMHSARLSQMHAYWLALPSIGVISPLLHTKIKELASDLLYMELSCVELEENIRTTYSEAELASATDKMEISKLHSLNYALERNLEEAKKRIEKMESAGEDESGLRVVLDNIVIALLAAPGGVDRLLDDELLNSISSREFASSKRREEKNILQRNLLEQSSGTPLQLLGPVPVPDPQQYCSNCKELYLDSDMPSLSSTHCSLQRESKINSAATECKGRTWDGALSDVPDIVTRLMLVASTALMRLQEDEAARATAFSTLIKCQSALRISNDEYDHLSRILESVRENNEAINIAMQDKEMRLTADLNFATDLVERQNAHIMTSEAKLQVTEREKRLLNAQLTAAGQKISSSTQTLHNMLLSFAQSAGMDLGSNSIDLVPGNFEYLFEYARLLFSKLLQSHKHATLSSTQSDDIHSRLDKDKDRERDKERDRDRGRARARARDKDVTSATKVESISSEVRDGGSDEDESESMGVKEGRLDEQHDFMFSKDDSRYIDDEITENKAVNESLLAAYLPIIQGGSGSGVGTGAGSGVGFVSKANDSDRRVRASMLQTSPSSSSQQRQEQGAGAGAGAGGGISMNGAGQYSQRSTRSNGEKRDGAKRDGRLIPSDHYHPQQLGQQRQQQSHYRQQLQERDHTGSTDIEMSSTDFIRYLRARRKDGSDPTNSSVQRDLFRSRNSDSTVASG